MFGAVRLGDFVSSTCKKPSGPFVTASSTSFVDGKPAAHIRSKVICGKIVNCSKTVFVDL